MQIATIGYEGADIGDFISTLKEVGIRHVLDVRELPVSRRKGFSKNILKEALAKVGIKYSHFKPLGDPKDGREAMRRGDRDTFLQIYRARLETCEATMALSTVMDIATEEPAVLLCYERIPKDCHRTLIAEKMEQKGAFFTRHLGVQSSRSTSRGNACVNNSSVAV